MTQETSLPHTFGNDLMASFVVFLVALPLCMGVAIASGLPPAAGIVTGVIGGLVVGVIAGSPLQVSGPAAGLTVLVWQLLQQYRSGTLGVIILLAGLIQVVAGCLKLGQWFRAVSPAVIHGMLAGIGVLIFASQLHVMLDTKPLGSGIDNLLALPARLLEAMTTQGPSLHALGIGMLTIAVIAGWGRFAPGKLKILPGPLMAVLVSTLVAAVFKLEVQHVDVSDNLWSVIQFPQWADLKHMVEIPVLLAAVSVAFIASAETLLCASAVDQMHQGPRTRYDQELLAQGVGNTLCGLLGVLPMTGVIVRSSANVNAGAQTRVSAIVHGVWLLLFVVMLPFTLRHIPVASLAGILVFTGYKLAYPKAVPQLLQFGRSEVAIYLSTILVIVTEDLLKGVIFGLLLSLFKLLYVFSRLQIVREDDADSNRVDLHLSGSATLIRLPMLAAALEKVPARTEVFIHFQNLDYIDHACLDLLANWERQHCGSGGKLVIEWDELTWKYHQRRGHQATEPAPGLSART